MHEFSGSLQEEFHIALIFLILTISHQKNHFPKGDSPTPFPNNHSINWPQKSIKTTYKTSYEPSV